MKPGRYKVSILGGPHQFTCQSVLDVIEHHADDTVTVRTLNSRYVTAGYVNRVPRKWDGGERVFTEVSQ